MEGCTYRKLICDLGHENVFGEGERRPQKCPVCNQPYDKIKHRPIYCFFDGTVPGDDKKETDETLENEPEAAVDCEPQQHMNEGMDTPNFGGNNEPPRRGRRPYNPIGEEGTNTGTGTNTRTSIRTPNPVSNDSDNGAIDSERVALFTGGDSIQIPLNGAIFGREGIGNEAFSMNPLISRKHAFISVDRFGKIHVRDEGSLNGTFVDQGNGRVKIKPHETVELNVGDTIWLANQLLAIEEIR